jgi:excisionase family DNA binding protein
MKNYYTMLEASDLLGVSYKTIQRKVKSGDLKSRKKGNTREVFIAEKDRTQVGQQTDKGSPQLNTKIGQKDTDKENVLPKDRTKDGQKGQGEVAFLRGMITKQQTTIDEQGKRLAELNQLVLVSQQTLARLNETLQLSAGITPIDRTEAGQETDTVRTPKGQKDKNKHKNDLTGRPTMRFYVLTLVLLLVLVIILGAVYYYNSEGINTYLRNLGR